jgi:DNA-binding transcriptional MerR regulator
MAKKKVMQQLDLFGMFAEPEATPEKELLKEEPVSPTESIVEEENTPMIASPIVEEEIIIEAVEAMPTPASQVVFSDGKISVKIKARPIATKENTAIASIQPAAKKVSPKTVTPKTENINPLRKRGRKSFKDMDAEVDQIEVPDEETLKKKLYYSIGEVAGFFKVNTSLIRAWENEFDILQPRKNRKGDRFFRVEDIKNLEMIYFLLRSKKLSVDGAKTYIKNNRKGFDTNHQLTQSLKKFRSFLLELKANLGA